MIRSEVRNKYLQWPTKENILAYKKAKSLFTVHLGKNWETTFSKIGIQGNHNNKKFWNIVMSFLTIKSVQENALILFEIKNKTVIEKQTLIHRFNSYHTNIAQNTSGKIP